MRRARAGVLRAPAFAISPVLGVALLVALTVLALGGANAAPAGATTPIPGAGARAAALIEAGSGEQLYGRSANSRQAIASATKLMTALVTLEHVHRLGDDVHAERLPVGGRGLADRARSGRADERPRPADRADAPQRRRRRRRPRVQRGPRVGREVRRDDERTGAPSSVWCTRTTRRRSGWTRRATTRALRTWSSSPAICCTPRRSSSGSSRSRARFCIPATTCDTVVNRNDLVAGSHGSTASRPATRCRRGTSWSVRGPGTG